MNFSKVSSLGQKRTVTFQIRTLRTATTLGLRAALQRAGTEGLGGAQPRSSA
jgi:hypothetical protein